MKYLDSAKIQIHFYLRILTLLWKHNISPLNYLYENTWSLGKKGQMVAGITTCILSALSHGILVYGADKRNRSAILVWIILQFIGLVAFSILALDFIFALRIVEDLVFLQNWKIYFILILIFVGSHLIPIWAVVVAIRVTY